MPLISMDPTLLRSKIHRIAAARLKSADGSAAPIDHTMNVARDRIICAAAPRVIACA